MSSMSPSTLTITFANVILHLISCNDKLFVEPKNEALSNDKFKSADQK